MNTLKTITLLLCMATIQIVVAQSTSVAVTDYSSQPAYRSGMIYLKLKDNAQIYLPKFKRGDKFDNYPVLKPFMNNYGISKVYRPFEKTKGIAFQHTYRVEFNPTADVEKLIRELTTLGMVEYAEKIPAEYTCFDPNDPKENDGSLWFLDKVNAYQAWDVTQGSGNVVVAVVDDAMYTTHEDLMANMWVNPDEIAGNGIDDDENGYIDDINGVDVADDDGNPNPPAALVSPTVFSHGSHCAGIVGSVTNNGVGVASIGSHIKVMGIKATRDATSSPGMIEAGWEGIQYAVAEGATIISLSWGGTSNSQTYQNLINSIEAQGVLVFAAAGNSNLETPFYPAAYNYVVGVGATDQSDYKASYSNYGSWVDITAPGSYIHGILCTGPSNYGIKSGTSMATPMAASLAGLMKSYNPAITPAELRTCMYNSADNLDALNPTYVGKMGAGRINAQGAVVCALPSACITPYNLTTSNIVGTSAQLNWSGTAGSTYTVQAREVGTASWGTYSASGTSYTLPVSTCKNYEFKVMANCGASGGSSYSATATFSTTVGGPQNYCTQPTPSASFGWIQNVQFAGISNNSGNNSGYSNAICSVGSVMGGTSYPVTLSPGFNSYAYNEYWRVYIDYNQDGDFTDSNELAYESGTSSTTTVNGNIAIPNTALSGNTRMRVMMKWFGTGDMTLPVPCTAYNYGEVEEYTINIGSAVQSCLAPSSTATNTITASGATLSWAAVSGTTTYPVQYKATSSSTWITVNAAATSTTLSGLAASTTYEWKVAASCGTYSTPLTFTTSAVAVACSTPSSATVTSLTATTAGLSWSSVSGASNYAVRCRVLNSTWSADLTATSNTATLSQLSPATTYEYQVKTNCASGVSAYSSSVNFITATPSCSAPSALSTSGISTSGLTLNWGAVTGGLTYTVRYRVNGSTTWTTMPTTTSTTQAISGLAATTTYELQAGSTCSGATVNYSTSITATTATPCGTPSTLAANSINSSGATLTWAAVTGATTYTIQYKTSSGTTWSSTTSTTTSKALTGLAASTAYDFKVMSTCSSGSSAYSAISTFTTTAASSCGIPSGVGAGSITASNATISWTAVSGATSYTIQYKLASGTIWSSTTATTNTKLLVGLVASTAYNVKVMSTCSSGSSAYTAITNFTTSAATTCGVPSGVTTSSISSTGATISWTAVSGSTSYTIQYKTSSATTWISTTSTTASKALTGLAASTTYNVKVMTTCSGGSSAYTAITNFTTSAATTCGVPSGVTTSSISSTGATISWTAVSGSTSYTIQYKTSSATTWISTTSTTASKALTGLTASTAYDVKVMTTCSGGSSAYTAITNFTTSVAPATCGVPSGVTTSSISSTGATISWTAVSGSTSYTIQYKTSSATTWISTTSTTASKALTGLTASTAYDVKVMTTCSGGSSAYTAITNFTTSVAPATCGVPTGLAMGTIATTTAVVNWTAVSGANQYTIQYKLASSTIWSSTTTTSNTKLLMGLVAGTAYNIKIMSSCSVGNSAYSSIVNFSTLPGTLSFNGLAYCEPSSNTANAQWINKVSFADIENYSANNNGYGDFSILSAEVVRGNTYTLDLQANNSNNAQWQIWIDYDQDGVFDNNTELVSNQEGANASAQITIPTEVYVGEARMRIALGNNTNACENTNGETEDYTLYIKPQNAIADVPNNFIESVSLSNQSYTSANQGNFSKATFSVQQGETYPLTLTAAYVQNTPAFWLIQIDYNNNGIYTDQNETLTVAANNNQSITTQLTVPSNASLADANIKVSLQHAGSSQAFVTDETEQYTLTILEATKNIALNNKICDDIEVSFNYSVEDNKVVFENTSTGKYNDLWWQFGDGSTNTDANPEHTYHKTGDYDISLTLSNTTTGCRQTFNGKVFITNGTAMLNNND